MNAVARRVNLDRSAAGLDRCAAGARPARAIKSVGWGAWCVPSGVGMGGRGIHGAERVRGEWRCTPMAACREIVRTLSTLRADRPY